MADLRTLISMVDALPPEDLEELYHYIRQRRQELAPSQGAVPATAPLPGSPPTPARAIRAQVDAIFDEAISAVKKKRETQELAKQGSGKQ